MKKALGPVFQAFNFDRASPVPLYRQLFEKLRTALVSGAIPPGSRLPSTRSLAQDLNLSRNTVTAAFERLIDHGFMTCRVGDGSYASDELARRPGVAGGPPAASRQRRDAGARTLSRRGEATRRAILGRDPLDPRPFSLGVPAFEAFPLKTWQRLVARHARQMTVENLRHGAPQGSERLRRAIASHLITSRGVDCHADQILILPSAQFGLDLVGRLLLDPGDAVWIEEPGYLGARGALAAAEANLVPVSVDEEGLCVEHGRDTHRTARLAYVTPSHQFPLGVSMSLRRRLQLLAWANEVGAFIVEDDYDSEYRYSGTASQALQGLDRSGRVLYLGTFSKVLFPALRVAYLVVPDDLVEAFVTARFLIDGHVAPAVQAALADFLESGHLLGHLRRMRNLYHERRDALLRELDSWNCLHVVASQTGMHLTARLDGDEEAWVAAATSAGLDITPLSRYCLESPGQSGLIFGYAHVPVDEIRRAFQALRDAWPC